VISPHFNLPLSLSQTQVIARELDCCLRTLAERLTPLRRLARLRLRNQDSNIPCLLAKNESRDKKSSISNMWDLFLSIIGKADAYLARFIIPYRYPPLRSDLAISDFQFLSTQLPPLDRYPEQILALVLSFALTFVYNPSSGKGKILFQSIVWAVVLSASTLFRWAKNSIIYFHSKALPTRQIESRKVRSDHMKDEIFKLKTSDYSPYPDKVLNLREYRCLLLKSAKNEDEVIVCELFHITNSMATPYYEALSYAWGTKLASRFILVDGKRLSVTENLFSALHHLRRNYRHRLLWVDAICIDQSNLKEQSQQVRIMDKIYQNAANVIVWLGPSTPESRLALRYIGFRMQLSHLPRIIEKFVAMKLLFKISRTLRYFCCNGFMNSLKLIWKTRAAPFRYNTGTFE
jgi:hypothetical protein